MAHTASQRATQRIIKIRRDYNSWVATETLEDYALRFTPRSFRKWSEFRVANTALGGAVSFLALEAISGAVTLSYGFPSTFWAMLAVGLIIFLSGVPISYYAAKYGVDMDLLTRGAGFGYIGSTVTSLIYASFTFIFFALEAAIMALALEMYFHIPLSLSYLVCALVVIPLVTHGITWISRLQLWTQPLWLTLLVLPYIFVFMHSPEVLKDFAAFPGNAENGGSFDLLLFGSAASVMLAMITQVGEQADYLRFMPEKHEDNRVRWWSAVLAAGPGWVIPGIIKMIGGAFLAFLAVQSGIIPDKAVEPTQMYLMGFRYVFSPYWALAATTVLVVVSQVKINVTNAYAGSLAWSNFFSRLTHNHPGRVVWLVFNVLIALVLMEMGVFKALEHVLALYSNVAIAWFSAVVADLVVNKPLGLSPRHIEFKRAYLYDINPVGVGAMLLASALSITAFFGVFGTYAQAFSPFIALAVAFVTAPLIAWATGGRYYIARIESAPGDSAKTGKNCECVICHNPFEPEDMATCPAYGGSICSLCCSLDARCQDLCKTDARVSEQITAWLKPLMPKRLLGGMAHSRLGNYAVMLAIMASLLAALLAVVYYQETLVLGDSEIALPELSSIFLKLFSLLLLVTAVWAWWVVLANETRAVAQEESNRQTHLLMNEINAHRETDDKLQRAKESAEAANLAKSRYLTGMSHELRTPLNSILGYAQILQKDGAIPDNRRDALAVIRRSSEHMVSLIDGLLDVAKIEAGKLQLDRGEVRLNEFLQQMVTMLRPQAAEKGLSFIFERMTRIPEVVHADERRLRQILINLLGNAVKFTEQGKVTLRASYRREMAYLEIEDTGIGIPESDLQRIFLPFERGANAGQHGEMGTGLGLPISKMLTALMGGELRVRSTPGAGTTFEVRLYLPEVAAPKTLARVETDIAGYTGRRRRVLIVDDQPSQREPLARLLALFGFETAQAGSGEECLRELATGRPDIVLLDIAMSGLNGWETSRLLRLNEAGPRVPVIMVSANAHDNDPEKRAVAGCDDFLVKPVLATELLNKLQLHLGLMWAYRGDAVPPAPPQPIVLPPAGDLRDLVSLGEIGYIKGILDKLDEIERLDERYTAFAHPLREKARNFRLEDYSNLLRQLTAHGAPSDTPF